MEGVVPQLGLGDDIKLRVSQELPKTKICNAYIPDDTPGKKLSQREVIKTLCSMNKFLKAEGWRVLNSEASGSKGHYWTFSMDDSSFVELKKIDMKPYFGFGRIEMVEKGSRKRSASRTIQKKDGNKASNEGKPKSTTYGVKKPGQEGKLKDRAVPSSSGANH